MRLRNDFFERMLAVTAGIILRHPWKVISAYVLLAVLSVIVSIVGLEFQTDQNALVSNDLEYNRRFLKFNEEFGDLEYLYVVIVVRDLPRAMAIADAVAEEMHQLPEYVDQVFHRVHVDPRSGLIFVPRELLDKAVASLKEGESTFRKVIDIAGLADLCGFVTENLDTDTARDHPQLAELGLQGLETFLDQLEAAVDGKPGKDPAMAEICGALMDRKPGVSGKFAGVTLGGIDIDEQLTNICGQGYLYTGDLLLLRILPKKDFQTLEVIREPLQAIRSALDRVRKNFPGAYFDLTGRPVLQADEMETTSGDMKQAALLAVLGVLALFRETHVWSS